MSEPTSVPVLTGIAPAAPAQEAAGAPVNLTHYRSPRGLYPFQVEGVAESYLWMTETDEPVADVLWQTGCIQGDAVIGVNRAGAGRDYLLRDLVHKFNGGKASNGHRWDPNIPTYVQRDAGDGTVRLGRLRRAWSSGVKTTYTVTTDTGRTIRATDEHPFLTERGWLRLDELRVGDMVRVRGEQSSGRARKPKPQYHQTYRMSAHPNHVRKADGSCLVPTHRLVAEATTNGMDLAEFLSAVRSGDHRGLVFLDPKVWAVHHLDHDHRNTDPGNLKVMTHVEHHRLHAEEGKTSSVLYKVVSESVVSVQIFGEEETYDLEVDDDPHNFIANGYIVHNTGKTHWTMATAALLVEDDKVDQIIVVAEANKMVDWKEDFEQFTDLSVQMYVGDPERRRKRLADPPKVLVMTWEMGRTDICTFKGGGSKAVTGDKVLTTFLKGKRVLIVFDEFSRARSRSTHLWIAWNYLCNRVLRHPKRNPGGRLMMAGLTATKIESSPEDHFNANLLLMPKSSPLVSEFEKDHISGYDYWGNVEGYKNLNPEDCERGVIPLSQRYAHRTLKKRKSDPDVIGFFPTKVEERPRYVALSTAHREFYDAVEDIFGEDSEMAAFGLLRQVAAHPMSLLGSEGKNAKAIVETIGAQTLAAMGSAKADEMIEWARNLGGEQGVIFTFYGQSVLPILHDRLNAEGFKVSINHGQMGLGERADSQRAFKDGTKQIFLSSDAGARGLNLGCGQALLHYELPLLYSTFLQRSDRIHRIDSIHESVTVSALIARGTVEHAVAELLLKRNGWSDAVLEDDVIVEGHDPGEQLLTAQMRSALWGMAKDLRKAA